MNKIVFICHPFQNKKENLEKTKEFCKLAIKEDCNPISPALLYSQFLDDSDYGERTTGRECGLELVAFCDELWICGNLITAGMEKEINEAYEQSMIRGEIPVRHRKLK